MTLSCSPKSIALAVLYLVLLLVFSLDLELPVKSIFPYAVPVVIVASRCGWRAGILVSLIATAVAWLGQAFPTVPENTGLEFDEALITFTELVIAAVISSAVSKKLGGAKKDELLD